MDSFMGLAKQGLQAYEASQSKGNDSNNDVNRNDNSNSSNSYNDNTNYTSSNSYSGNSGYNGNKSNNIGGQHLNSDDNGRSNQQWGYGPQINEKEAVEGAKQNGSGETSLFTSALGFLNQNQPTKEPLDERGVQDSHRQAYQEDKAGGMSASSLGSAAAMQILKQFTSSGSGSSSGKSGSGSQTQLISLAMAEATKLFDKSGGTASGNKQDAVNGAAMTVMKLMVQSKFSGGSSSEGSGGLMKIASQFLSK